MRRFLPAATWSRTDIDKTICHQVGSGHRKLMLESLGIDPRIDYATFPWLGNTGSAALPVSLALASQTGFVSAGDRVALLGIGSGINCIMVAADWNYCPVRGNSDTSGRPGLGDSS
jgi:3-oxoacyl-[acyl-carrier-protein] synthase-3